MNNTIFFGNGLNLLHKDNLTWSQILDNLKASMPFLSDQLPNTMTYERIVIDHSRGQSNVRSVEFELKRKLALQFEHIFPTPLYSQLFHLDAQNYITTNYDYAFLAAIKSNLEVSIQEYSTEDVYSIRRCKEVSAPGLASKYFWQIHGEIKKPATIMLGLDHYCGAIGKIDAYVKGFYKYRQQQRDVLERSIEDKFEHSSFSNSSWVELFFHSNIHILAFSLDYTETDLWWILNRRARLMNDSNFRHQIKNHIYFYCDQIDRQKEDLLRSFHVEPIVARTPPKNYELYYYHVVEEISKRL